MKCRKLPTTLALYWTVIRVTIVMQKVIQIYGAKIWTLTDSGERMLDMYKMKNTRYIVGSAVGRL